MTAILVTPPDHTRLVTTAEFISELALDDPDQGLIDSILVEAESRVEDMLGRPVVRAKYTETLTDTWVLSVRPVLRIDAVAYQSSTHSVSDFTVGRNGIIRRTATAPFLATLGTTLNHPDGWIFTYTAGWFVPEDDITGSLSVIASDKSYNGTAIAPTHLCPGDQFDAVSFYEAGNAGRRVVATVAADKITVANTLTNESAATRKLRFQSIPGGIRRAVITLAKHEYHSRTTTQSGGVKSEEIAGATSITYGSESSSSSTTLDGSEADARSLLSPYMDL